VVDRVTFGNSTVPCSGTAITRGVKRFEELFISPFGSVLRAGAPPWMPSTHTTTFDASVRSFPDACRRTRPEIVPAGECEAGRRRVSRTAAESVLIPQKNHTSGLARGRLSFAARGRRDAMNEKAVEIFGKDT
jgi:hypothetical protein